MRISKTYHGESNSRFYNIYNSIIARCYRQNSGSFKSYGSFGIECEWLTYEDFKRDMYKSYLEHCDKYGEKDTTIERENILGNYCKENCRWATRKEQSRNKSTTRRFSWKGERLTAMDIYEKEKPNVDYEKFRNRLKRGWEVGRALGIPNRRELEE